MNLVEKAIHILSCWVKELQLWAVFYSGLAETPG